MIKSIKVYLLGILVISSALAVLILFVSGKERILISYVKNQYANVESAFMPAKDVNGNVLYKGDVRHIFFHSLIVYPDLAYGNNKMTRIYKDYMITRDDFEKILPELYKNNFILVDINTLYNVDKDGTVTKKPLYLPAGKKPLVISLDDLSYYYSMAGNGFADKLVLDENGNVATEIVTPEGKKEVTRDGDVVPILDDFVALHPDFSFQGAKGLIAVTGYEGILGYRTDSLESATHPEDLVLVAGVISKLKSTGWSFASHSYSHRTAFSTGTISLKDLKKDTEQWDKEVRPLVGETNVFVGPFGQIFSPNDPRRNYLISQGFKMFCGVGMDQYFRNFTDSIVMDRGDVDGYRLAKTPNLLKPYFDPSILGFVSIAK